MTAKDWSREIAAITPFVAARTVAESGWASWAVTSVAGSRLTPTTLRSSVNLVPWWNLRSIFLKLVSRYRRAIVGAACGLRGSTQ